jgi:hypothetical protein
MLSCRREQPWVFMEGILVAEVRTKVSRRAAMPVIMKLCGIVSNG